MFLIPLNHALDKISKKNVSSYEVKAPLGGELVKYKKMNLSETKKLGEVLENFKVLVKNLVPITPDQAEWICDEVERLSKEYPGLIKKLKELHGVLEGNTELKDKPLTQILTEIGKQEKRRRRTRGAGKHKAKRTP